MKKVLVTGGAGFLGSHLCDTLWYEGHQVFCMDNFFTGSDSNLKLEEKDKDFYVIYHDVTEPFHNEVDEIYHLACPASPVHYQRNPVRTIKTCVAGTINALELAREVGAKLLIASTSEVYGDPAIHPQVESYWGHVNPIGPRACYDEGKRCAEAMAVSFARQFNVDVEIARIFNTYGPRMAEEDGRVVSNFIVRALHNEPLTIYGDGKQTRSFCYVSDLISGLKLMMEKGPSAAPINLGNPTENTMIELAEAIIELCDSDSVMIHDHLPPDDPRKRNPCISKAQTLLGWTPQVILKRGLTYTIEYFKYRHMMGALQ